MQNAVKSWEMELSHKIHLKDFKTINPEKFKLIVNVKNIDFKSKPQLTDLIYKFINLVAFL